MHHWPAHHFLTVYGRQYSRTDLRLSSEALHKLLAYEWPGNVREMEGVIQRAVILSSSSILQPDDIDLPSEISEPCSETSGRGQGEGEIVIGTPLSEESSFHKKKVQVIEQFERGYLTELLVTHRGNIAQAARSAKKERRFFQRLLQKYGLDRRALSSRPDSHLRNAMHPAKHDAVDHWIVRRDRLPITLHPGDPGYDHPGRKSEFGLERRAVPCGDHEHFFTHRLLQPPPRPSCRKLST